MENLLSTLCITRVALYSGVNIEPFMQTACFHGFAWSLVRLHLVTRTNN